MGYMLCSSQREEWLHAKERHKLFTLFFEVCQAGNSKETDGKGVERPITAWFLPEHHCTCHLRIQHCSNDFKDAYFNPNGKPLNGGFEHSILLIMLLILWSWKYKKTLGRWHCFWKHGEVNITFWYLLMIWMYVYMLSYFLIKVLLVRLMILDFCTILYHYRGMKVWAQNHWNGTISWKIIGMKYDMFKSYQNLFGKQCTKLTVRSTISKKIIPDL